MRQRRVLSVAAVTAAVVAGWLAAGCRPEGPPPIVGTLERDRLELIAESDDAIVEITAREGDDLEAGALVVRLDDARMRRRIENLEAQRDVAAGRLAELVRGPRRESIEEGQARLAGDEKTLEIAELELRRAETLVAEEVSPQSHADEMRRQRDAALSRRDQDRAALAALLEGTTIEELEQARAAVAAAEAELADARLRLGRLEVRAPVAGRLDALPFELGERPSPGATVAVLLAGGAPYARVYVPEPLFASAPQGARAEIRIDGDPRVFHGHVRRISSEAAFTPHFALTERDRGRLAFLAEIELDDEAARELPTGVPLEASLPGAPAEESAP